MSWNYRVLNYDDNGELYYKIHEVYYENEIPNAYSTNPATIEGDSLEELSIVFNQMILSLNKPILSKKDFNLKANSNE